MVTEDRYLPNFILKNPIRGISSFPVDLVLPYIHDGDVIADIGCGPGYYSLKLSRMFPKSKIIAVDPNENAISYLKRRIKNGRITNITPVCESANSMKSILDCSADFVFSHLMLCCMTDHDGGIKESTRILKPGGISFISINKINMKKKASHKDPKDVSYDEWNKLKIRYNIIKEGSSLMSRWFIAKGQVG